MAFADKFDKFVVMCTAIGKGYNKEAGYTGHAVFVLKDFYDNGNIMEWSCPSGYVLVNVTSAFTIYNVLIFCGLCYNFVETCW